MVLRVYGTKASSGVIGNEVEAGKGTGIGNRMSLIVAPGGETTSATVARQVVLVYRLHLLDLGLPVSFSDTLMSWQTGFTLFQRKLTSRFKASAHSSANSFKMHVFIATFSSFSCNVD